MENKRFLKNDEGFVCAHCGKTVEPLGRSSRNHCPFCLWSLHVDVLPGDRANPCRGALRPVAALTDPRKGFVLIHRCERCGTIVRCRAAHDAPVQPDSLSLLIELTTHSGDVVG